MGELTKEIAITGATGFVGSHILHDLIKRNYTVRTLVRSTRPTIMTHNPSGSTTIDNAAASGSTILSDRDDNGVAECQAEGESDETPKSSIPDTEQGSPNPSNAKEHDTKVIEGDLFNNASLEKLVEGASVVVHLVGIIREYPKRGVTFEHIHVEGTKRLLAAAKKAGVKRWIQMSALGTRAEAASRYHQTKYEAEQAVMASGLDWTIFRPSLIHGPDGEFMLMVKDMLTRELVHGGTPFTPYFAKGMLGREGGGLVQPVYVGDVAKVFVDAITNDATIGHIYEVAGPDEMTWPQMYGICQRYMKGAKARHAVGLPAWLAKGVAQVAESVGFTGLPFGADQVVMAGENNTASVEAMAELDQTFHMERAKFETMVSEYGPRMA